MRLWRMSSHPGLTGIGGTFDSGRWHVQSHYVTYAAEHPALAMVETMAHMRLSLANIPTTLKLIAIDVADGALIAPVPSLPSGWQANELTTRTIGTAWLVANTELLLPVPSAILAHATNYILNCTHAQSATHLGETLIEPFWFDKRYLS